MWLLDESPQRIRRSATFAALISGIVGTLNLSISMIVGLNSFAGYFFGIIYLVLYGPISVAISLVVAHLYLVPLIHWVGQRWRRGPLIVLGINIFLFTAVALFIYFQPILEQKLKLSLLLFPYFLNLGVLFCLFAYRKRKLLTTLTLATILIPIISVYSIGVNSYAATLQRVYPELENRVSQVRLSETLGEGAYVYRFKIEEQDLEPLIMERNLDEAEVEFCGKALNDEGGYWVGWRPGRLKDSICYVGLSEFYLSYHPLSKVAYIVNINT